MFTFADAVPFLSLLFALVVLWLVLRVPLDPAEDELDNLAGRSPHGLPPLTPRECEAIFAEAEQAAQDAVTSPAVLRSNPYPSGTRAAILWQTHYEITHMKLAREERSREARQARQALLSKVARHSR